MKGRLAKLGAVLVTLLALPAMAQQFVAPYVTFQGTLSNASGIPAQNATLTFQLNQVGFVAGTSTIVTSSQCATDVSGAVVGIGNPQTGPRVSTQNTGTLPAGNYYVEFSWYDQFANQTLVSPEVPTQLTTTGELQILPPVGNGPPQATGLDVYIGTSSGGETYQGQTTSTTAQYTQAVPLTTGAAVPTHNATPCRVFANDAIWPTGTGYQVSLVDSSGNTLFQYPQMWQVLGPGSSYNLSQGIPYYNGQVTYPVPILSQPTNHNPQSIAGPLIMGQAGGPSYSITNVSQLGVGTSLPGWGIDVEGSGLNSRINALGGYLANGAGGTSGQCLASDGTAFDTPQNCVTALPTLYYQTVYANGTALTQRGVINFGPEFNTRDVVNVSPTPSWTGVDLAASGATAGTYAPPVSVTVDTYGRVTAISQGTAANRTCNANGCYRIESDGTIEEWGTTQNFTSGCSGVCGTATVTFPYAFPTAATVTSASGSCASSPCASGVHPITATTESVTLSGYTVYFDANGATISGVTPVAYWHAWGY